jgi:large subunit ribosomal protein L1
MMKTKQLPENYDRTKQYTVAQAAELLPKLSTSKFAGSVDIDVVLSLSEKQLKETVRGSVVFPHQFGKEVKVLVFAEEKDAKAALEAGADFAGLEDLMDKVEKGTLEFDVVIATPAVMPKIAKLGRVLGPKGLMPNPANQTVTPDVVKAIASYKAGKQDFKMSEQGAIRGKVAKVDLAPEQIAANINAFLKSVYNEAKKLNGQPFRKITVSPTMGSPVKIDVTTVSESIK